MSGRVAAVAARTTKDGKTIALRRRGLAAACGSRSTAARRSSRCSTSSRCSRSARSRIDPTNPKTVWVGTGEAWTRNSVSIGDGIYKSTDGGETWTNMGLPKSERIARILVASEERQHRLRLRARASCGATRADRGLYKTTDGGKTWSLVLKGANLSTGCSSVAMDPKNPDALLAGMWDFRRKGWTFRSGGDGPDAPSGSGLLRSSRRRQDLDATLDATNKGLPAEPVGPRRGRDRAVRTRRSSTRSSSRPSSALYRSDDGGETWEERDTQPDDGLAAVLLRAAWSSIRQNPDRLFKPDLRPDRVATTAARASPTPAAARTATGTTSGSIPTNTKHVIGGDDGGLWYRYDGGNRWWKSEQPADLAVLSRQRRQQGPVPGLRRPAGQQLLGRRLGISRAASPTAAGRTCTAATASGRSPIRPIPNYVYAESQGGYIGRVNRKTHERARHPAARPDYKEKLRFNWNTPIHCQPDAEGHDLHRRAVPVPLARPRRHLGAHLARPHDQRSGEAEAGAVGRHHRRQLVGRDAHDDLLDQRVAEGRRA